MSARFRNSQSMLPLSSSVTLSSSSSPCEETPLELDVDLVSSVTLSSVTLPLLRPSSPPAESSPRAESSVDDSSRAESADRRHHHHPRSLRAAASVVGGGATTTALTSTSTATSTATATATATATTTATATATPHQRTLLQERETLKMNKKREKTAHAVADMQKRLAALGMLEHQHGGGGKAPVRSPKLRDSSSEPDLTSSSTFSLDLTSSTFPLDSNPNAAAVPFGPVVAVPSASVTDDPLTLTLTLTLTLNP
jgi:hypothetical protein